MAVIVKHTKVSAIADGADTSVVRPSDWNADHTLTGLGTAASLDAGVANGVATLDSSATVPISQLPAAVVGAVSYQGTWNASTNTPTLASSTGTKGYYYVVAVAGSTNLNGITDWKIGDWAIYSGTAWQKIDNTDAVQSVNGQTGAVVLTYTDVGAQVAGTYVNSVSATSPITSSGGATPTIAMPAATGSVNGYLTSADWTTFNAKQTAFGSQTANTVYAAPNGSAGTPTFRAIVAADVPTLNQNTTGTAANVTGTVAIANGGTGATTAADARTALGLGTIATQAANSVAITGGAIDGTTVGSTTAAAGSFTTLNSSGATRLGGASGNQSLQVNNVASAVNYAQIVGAVAGGAPTFSALGTDTNINLKLTPKGTGRLSVSSAATVGNATDAASQFAVSLGVGYSPGSAWTTNSATFGGIQSTGSPAAGAVGIAFDTTNGGWISSVAPGQGYYNLRFDGQLFDFVTTGSRQFRVQNTGSAVNYAQATGAVTTGAPELSAQGSDANINLKLTPKGTGGVWFTGPLLPNNLAGTSGQVLTSAGAGAVPTWAAAVSSNITAQGLYENSATISANYTIGTGNNAVSAGPITINSGVVVTVPSGSTWVVV